MSEDLFEGEKGEDAGDASVAYGDSSAGNTPRISAVDKLYIVLIRYGNCFFTFMVYFVGKLCNVRKLHVNLNLQAISSLCTELFPSVP
jgi:hypothetical protein